MMLFFSIKAPPSSHFPMPRQPNPATIQRVELKFLLRENKGSFKARKSSLEREKRMKHVASHFLILLLYPVGLLAATLYERGADKRDSSSPITLALSPPPASESGGVGGAASSLSP
jgi:hypothetical protein